MACRVATFASNGRTRQTDYASVKEAFCAWLATPKEAPGAGAPQTLTDFGLAYGVHRATLWGWKSDEKVQERVRAHVDAYLHSGFGTVAHALVESAEAGNMAAIQTYFRYFIGVRDGDSLDSRFERQARKERDRKRANRD